MSWPTDILDKRCTTNLRFGVDVQQESQPQNISRFPDGYYRPPPADTEKAAQICPPGNEGRYVRKQVCTNCQLLKNF